MSTFIEIINRLKEPVFQAIKQHGPLNRKALYALVKDEPGLTKQFLKKTLMQLKLEKKIMTSPSLSSLKGDKSFLYSLYGQKPKEKTQAMIEQEAKFEEEKAKWREQAEARRAAQAAAGGAKPKAKKQDQKQTQKEEK
jgi:predicted transposase YbfD/YdcC